MNPGGGVAESCREEDPLTCHMDRWILLRVLCVKLQVPTE